MRHLIKHLGIIHNDLAGSCLDFIINLVTTSGYTGLQIYLCKLRLDTGVCGSKNKKEK